MGLFEEYKNHPDKAVRERAGSIGKCKFSEKFEELLFWR